MDNQKNQNVKFEKIKNHLKKNALNADKMQIKIILLFLLVGLHIFLIPNDILDKFPFLASYTEFVANYVPFVKTISLQIKSIPQIATFYASNMVILSLFIFFPLFVYNALLTNIKRFEMFGWYEYNPYFRESSFQYNTVLMIPMLCFCIYACIYLFFYNIKFDDEEKILSIGNFIIYELFSRNSEIIKIKFGLFHKITIIYGCAIIFTVAFSITTILNILIQNFNKKFNTKDKK